MLNAAFVDLTIQRWELEIEWQIRLRHGASLADPSFPENEETYLAERERIDGAREALRGQGTNGLFPLEQVIATHGLDPTEAEILKLALMPRRERLT